jgi:hypothetical protein
MSQNAQKEMCGILFKNDRKAKPTHADYQGSCTIEGVEYWMNAWLKDGAKGKFFSFAFKPKQEAQTHRVPASKNTPIDLDDEIPF